VSGLGIDASDAEGQSRNTPAPGAKPGPSAVAVATGGPLSGNWNIAEHRVFAFVTQNWRGKLLIRTVRCYHCYP
jgi:hypothetical protein